MTCDVAAVVAMCIVWETHSHCQKCNTLPTFATLVTLSRTLPPPPPPLLLASSPSLSASSCRSQRCRKRRFEEAG